MMSISSQFNFPIVSRITLLNTTQQSFNAIPNPKYRKLNDEQLKRCGPLLEPSKTFALTSLDPAHPDIKFNIAEIMGCLYKELAAKKISHGPLCFSGGFASHVLSGLPYRDIDLSMDIHSAVFLEVNSILQDFLKSKLDLSKFHSKDALERYLQTLYFHKETKNDWAYFKLGEVEIKFIFAKNGRHHVSTADSFYIPITQEQHFTSAEQDIEAALDDLQRKKFLVYNPERVEELIFRVVHKQTQGFVLINPNRDKDVCLISLNQFLKQFPLDQYEKKAKLNRKFHSFFKNHFSQKDTCGKLIAFLNFLSLFQQMENSALAQSYSKIMASVLRSEGNQFVKLVEQYPSNIRDLLAVIQGLFLLEWINENPNVNAYQILDQPCFSMYNHHFSLSGEPGRIISDFLVSWRELELEGIDIEDLASDLGLSGWVLTKQTRPGIVKTLLNSYQKEPLKQILEHQYQGQISPESFCKTIRKEIEIIERETPNILNNAYIWCRTLPLQLRHYLKTKRINNDLIQALLNLFSPTWNPNVENIRQLTKAFKKSSKDWCQDDGLVKIFENSISFLMEEVRKQNDKELLTAIQKLTLVLHDRQIFSIQYRCNLALSLITSKVLGIYKFIEAVSLWEDKTQALQNTLKECLENHILLLIYMNDAVANNEECDFAYQHLEKILPTKKLNTEFQDLFFNFVSLVNENSSQRGLLNAGKIAKQIIPRIQIDLKQMDLLLKLSHRIDADLNDRNLNNELLLLLEHKAQNKKVFRDIFLNRVIELLTSKKSDDELKEGIEDITKSLLKWEHAPEGFLDSLKKVGELEGSNRQKVINTLLLAFVQVDLALAKEVLESSSFKSLDISESNQIKFNLIKSLAEQKLEIDFAFHLWNEAEKSHGKIKYLTISLELLQALPQGDKPDPRIPVILKTVLEALQDPHKKITSSKSQEIKKALLQVISSSELLYKEQIIQICLTKDWIKPKQLESMYGEKVISSIKNNQLDLPTLKKYMDVLWQDTKPNNQTIESIFEYAVSNPTLLHKIREYCLEAVNQGISNPALVSFCSKLIRMLPIKPSKDAVEISSSNTFIHALIGKEFLKHLSKADLSFMLNFAATNRQANVCKRLVRHILKIDTWEIFYGFVIFCHKECPSLNRIHLIESFQLIFSCKKFKEKKEARSLYIEFLCETVNYSKDERLLAHIEKEWAEIENEPLELKRKVLSTYLESRNVEFFIKACQQLIPKSTEPVNCSLVNLMITNLSTNEFYKNEKVCEAVFALLEKTFLRIALEHIQVKTNFGIKMVCSSELEKLCWALYGLSNQIFGDYFNLAKLFVENLKSIVPNTVTTESLVCLSSQDIYKAFGMIHTQIFYPKQLGTLTPFVVAELLEKLAKKYFSTSQMSEYSDYVRKNILNGQLGKFTSLSENYPHRNDIQKTQWNHTLGLYINHDKKKGIACLWEKMASLNNEGGRIEDFSLLTMIYLYGNFLGIFSDDVKSQYKKFQFTATLLRLNNMTSMALFNDFVDLIHYDQQNLEHHLKTVVLVHDSIYPSCVIANDFSTYKLFLQALGRFMIKTLGENGCESKSFHPLTTILFSILYRSIVNHAGIPYLKNLMDFHYPKISFWDACKKFVMLNTNDPLAIKISQHSFKQFCLSPWIKKSENEAKKFRNLQNYQIQTICYNHSASQVSMNIETENLLKLIFVIQDEVSVKSFSNFENGYIARQMILNFFEELLKTESQKIKGKESKIANVFAYVVSGYVFGIPNWLNPIEKANLEAYHKKLKSMAKTYSPKFIDATPLHFSNPYEFELLKPDDELKEYEGKKK